MGLEGLFSSDVKTLISVLFWYNLVVVIANLVYRITAESDSKFEFLNVFTWAKVFQSIAFFLLYFRDRFPDFVSVNVGNSLLFLGFFYEALTIYEILDIKSKRNKAWLLSMLGCSLIFFNAVEIFVPSPSIRVVSASFGVFAILLMPSVALIFSKKSNAFRRVTGVFYLTFTLLLLPRIVSMLNDSHASLFTNNLEQELTFLSLIMVNAFSCSTFLIQMKDNVDKVNQQSARIDFLTKLTNRYHFLELAEAAFGVHKSKRHSLTVLFIDFDRFRNINAKYGYGFGDKVLVAFSEILRTNMGDSDLVCRYDGEEVLAVLPQSDISDGYAKAKKIMDEVHAIRFEEFPDFEFTVSIGIVSGFPSGVDAFFKYLEEADKLLCKAKSNGGDRIEYESLKQA